MSDCFDHMQDAWDDCLFGATSYGLANDLHHPRTHRSVYGPPLTCNHCGARGLYWQKVKGAYRIHTIATLQPHVCNTGSLDTFTKIEE